MSNEKSATVTKLTVIPPRQYPDLHDHLERLEREGLLIRVNEPVDKDQEMHPLVRWQFRGGIKEKDRKAFLFEKPVDAKVRLRYSRRDWYFRGQSDNLWNRSRLRSN